MTTASYEFFTSFAGFDGDHHGRARHHRSHLLRLGRRDDRGTVVATPHDHRRGRRQRADHGGDERHDHRPAHAGPLRVPTSSRTRGRRPRTVILGLSNMQEGLRRERPLPSSAPPDRRGRLDARRPRWCTPGRHQRRHASAIRVDRAARATRRRRREHPRRAAPKFRGGEYFHRTRNGVGGDDGAANTTTHLNTGNGPTMFAALSIPANLRR